MAGLGFPPFYAAVLCLIGNTAPVAFGSIGIPIVTLTQITGLPMQALSAMTGRILSIVALLVPVYLLVLMAGATKTLAVWPAVVACAVTFAATQFLVSNFIGPELTAILASLASLSAMVLLMKIWKPSRIFRLEGDDSAERPAVRHRRRCDIPGVDAVPAPRHLRADLGIQADEGLARRHDDDDDSRAVAAQHDSAHAAGHGAARTLRGPVRLQLAERRGNGVRAVGCRGGGGAASAAQAIRRPFTRRRFASWRFRW